MKRLILVLILLWATTVNAFLSDQASITSDAVSLTGALGSSHTASPACVTGYTRVGLWCMDTDGTLVLLRAMATVDEASYTSTVVTASAKMIMLRAAITNISGLKYQCIIPGDSAVTACSNTTAEEVTGQVDGLVAISSWNTIIVQAGSTGNVKTRCVFGGGNGNCFFFIMGYMD